MDEKAAMEPDEDDEAMRSYVSKLWAEDWDSPEDRVYDMAPFQQVLNNVRTDEDLGDGVA